MGFATGELFPWWKQLLPKLRCASNRLIRDNEAISAFPQIQIFLERTKHIAVDFCF